MSDETNTTSSYQDDDVQIPTKSVDPADSLEDRLTDNVRNAIGPSRYFQDGEDWGDTFHRVGTNVAIPQAVFHDLPLSVSKDELADWVSDEKAEELFFKPAQPSRSDPDPNTQKEYVGLDEEIAPYVDFEKVVDAAPDDIAGELIRKSDEFETAMREQRFIPNSPTIMNAGGELQQLSACFVVEPGDAMTGEADDGRASIMQAAENAADVFKSGGGVGYPAHLMRPKGDLVSSTGGVTSGPMSFLQIYDSVCGTVKQGGKRRGAQMAIMHSQHPDIGRFCVAKRDEENLTNFNISVAVTDDFHEAVQEDEEYTLVDPKEGYTDPEPFTVVPETAHFYDPEFEDAWNDELNKPGAGIDGKVVEDNFWRDYVETMGNPEAFDEYKDQISLEPGEPMSLPAGFIWELMVDGAHNLGEPGFVNIDKINEEHSFDVEEDSSNYIHATNPCVTGDTLISTSTGLQRAEDLYEAGTATDIVVDSRLSDERMKEASSVFKTGVKDVIRVVTDRGYELRVTEDHRIKTDDGWVEAGNLSDGDSIHIQDRKGEFGSHGSEEVGRVLGWLVGDGFLKEKEGRAVLSFFDNDSKIADQFADDANKVVRDATGNGNYEISANSVNRSGGGVVEKRVRSTRLYEIADEFGLTEEKLTVPEQIYTGSEEMARGFISALFTADGSVQGTKEKGHSVRLTSVSEDLLKEVQKVLLNFGIASTIYTDRRPGGKRELPDGNGGSKEYDTQARHELVVSSLPQLLLFNKEIGFLSEEKQNDLDEICEGYSTGEFKGRYTADVDFTVEDGTEAVYDLTEPDTSSFIADGGVVHNCAEQPLENYEACNLGHVNLSLMVDEDAVQFDKWKIGTLTDDFDSFDTTEQIHSYLDYALDQQLFRDTCRTGTDFLENVVTMSKFPLDKIEDMVHGQRKIGLGLMGYHQMLLQMGIQYGSDASYEVAREIMRRIDQYGTERSHEIAQERGSFRDWDDSKWSNPDEYPEWFEKHGHNVASEYDDGYAVRNHNITTIAPTGSTSMVGDTSGGCEPIYKVAYFKNVSDDVQGDDMLVEFDDYFLRTIEANGIDADTVKDEAREKMYNDEFDSVQDLETVPDKIAELFVTSEQLDVEQHIRVQAAFQEYCDSGVSKTLNVSNDATLEDVDHAIDLALDLGIKGATIYRTGSRTEEVLTTSSTGGGVSVQEADEEDLVDELTERLEEEPELQKEVLDELGLDDVTETRERVVADGGQEL